MASRKKKAAPSRKAEAEEQPQVRLIADDEHPGFAGGSVGEDGEAAAGAGIPNPDGGPLPPFPPFPPVPGPIPPLPGPPRPSFPIEPIPRPIPRPVRICPMLSGRYVLARTPPLPPPRPVLPLPLVTVAVRVDVDRYYPQNRISIEVTRRFPRATAHVIAEVSSDRCVGYAHRVVDATITYRDGDASLIPGDQVRFEATRGLGFRYGQYTLTLSGSGTTVRTYTLAFQSQYFDSVEFEVDRVANSGAIVTTYDTGSHPNRPAGLPSESISLATTYQRAGFDVTMSPNATVIPATDAGANTTWSDGEMHNAMVTYWSRFADRPQWAMWVLYAARHDTGRSLGGVMFDDIGANHRQGTAIFTDSFIQDAPAGDANAVAWRNRMQYWTAIHEMGHAFNLAHAWQKAMGTPQGAPGDPWIPLVNEPESRSFMNYPFRVSGGESAFFADFEFRFTDDELIFMRHAPRRFVQMGNSDWFVNHGFEAPRALARESGWQLKLRPNRDTNAFQFLEPVTMELKLTNVSGRQATVDEHLLRDGRHVTVIVQREGGIAKPWRPMITHCHAAHDVALDPGASIYASHTVGISTTGWIIDEPGFYKVQAALDIDGDIVISNVLRLYVTDPTTGAESAVASDYFTEDVGRALVFGGAPDLPSAMATLEGVRDRCPSSAAALHAAVALSSPRLRVYKRLEVDPGGEGMSVQSTKADVGVAAKAQTAALIDGADRAAKTFGHICYFEALDRLASAMTDAGNDKGAKRVMTASVATMKKRDILGSVIKATERRLDRMA